MKFQMLGSADKPGPVRLSDVYNSQVGDASMGIAASQKALYDAYSSLNSRISIDTVTLNPNYGIADCNDPPSVISRYGGSTLNSPYKKGLTTSANGLLITTSIYTPYNYTKQIAIADSGAYIYERYKVGTETYSDWTGLRAAGIYDTGHSAYQSSLNQLIHTERQYGADSGGVAAINIDRINNPNGYIYRVITGTSMSGTSPSSTIGGGNAFLLIGFSQYTNSKLYYGVQMAIGFGGNKIALRNANYNSNGTSWSAWRAI